MSFLSAARCMRTLKLFSRVLADDSSGGDADRLRGVRPKIFFFEGERYFVGR